MRRSELEEAPKNHASDGESPFALNFRLKVPSLRSEMKSSGQRGNTVLIPMPQDTEASNRTQSITEASEHPPSSNAAPRLSRDSGKGPYWPLVGLTAVFLASPLVVPLFLDVPVNDDWVYARSVDRLFAEGRIDFRTDFVFQTLWAALFGFVFEPSLAIYRFSSFLLFASSGPAFFGVCRMLGIQQPRALAASAVYLFNPVSYSLAFTFMNDAPFVALLVWSAYLYLRGLKDRKHPAASLVGASALAACAYFVRKQGLLIAPTVLLFLLISGRIRWNRPSIKLILQCAGVPGVLLLADTWLGSGGILATQGGRLEDALLANRAEQLTFFWRLGFVAAMYAGLFVLPLAPAFISGIHTLVGRLASGGKVLISAGLATAIIGLVDFSNSGRLMPYLPHFFNFYGLGPTDLQGGERDAIMSRGMQIWLTAGVVMALLILILAIASRMRRPSMGWRGSMGWRTSPILLIAGLAIGQFIGAGFASYVFSAWPQPLPLISLDRYLLVLMPFSIWMLMWSFRRVKWNPATAAVTVACLALFSIVGTRDFMVFQRAVSDMASKAQVIGVPKYKLDAGAGWDGYNLGGVSPEDRRTVGPPEPPWWFDVYGVDSDGTFVVSPRPMPGFTPFFTLKYSQWLPPRAPLLYLSRRDPPPTP